MRAKCVYEDISFERGKDPKDVLDIGDKGMRIYKKLSDIAKSLGIKETSIDDLNEKLAIAAWKNPGLSGNTKKGTVYGRIILYKSIIGDHKDYRIYTVGKNGSDLQDWTAWDSAAKWKENLSYLNGNIDESVSFERGKDPRKALEVGMEHFTFHADYIVISNRYGESMIQRKKNILSDEDAIASLKSMYLEPLENLLVVEGKNYPHSPYSSYSIGLLKMQPQIKYIEYKGEYYKIPKGVRESVNFERGQDPKKALNIGNKLYRQNLEALNNIKDKFSHISEDPKVYASKLAELGVRLNSIVVKTSRRGILYGVAWINSKGGMQYRLLNLPNREKELFSKVTEYIRGTEGLSDKKIEESVSFQRGRDPKGSMGIGLVNMRKFPNMMEFIKWLVKVLHIILDVPPEDLKEEIEKKYIINKPWAGTIPDDLFSKICKWVTERGPFTIGKKNNCQDLYSLSSPEAFPGTEVYGKAYRTWTDKFKEILEEKGLLPSKKDLY